LKAASNQELERRGEKKISLGGMRQTGLRLHYGKKKWRFMRIVADKDILTKENQFTGAEQLSGRVSPVSIVKLGNRRREIP